MMYTRFHFSSLVIQLATVGPCAASLGTVRKKYPRRLPSVWPSVSVVRLAEPETNPRPPPL